MRILLVAATVLEVKKFTLQTLDEGIPVKVDSGTNQSLYILITGVGAAPTAFYMGRYAEGFDVVINIGIAGSYSSKLAMGQVVVVRQDMFGDYGIDDNGKFQTLSQAGLMGKSLLSGAGLMVNPWIGKEIVVAELPLVSGITLGTASGSESIVERVTNTWNPDIETMEGAAVFYSCLLLHRPFICLRAISNWVGPRNADSWNIDGALNNLHAAALKFIQSFGVTAW